MICSSLKRFLLFRASSSAIPATRKTHLPPGSIPGKRLNPRSSEGSATGTGHSSNHARRSAPRPQARAVCRSSQRSKSYPSYRRPRSSSTLHSIRQIYDNPDIQELRKKVTPVVIGSLLTSSLVSQASTRHL
jgi:hypothetical protein